MCYLYDSYNVVVFVVLWTLWTVQQMLNDMFNNFWFSGIIEKLEKIRRQITIYFIQEGIFRYRLFSRITSYVEHYF